MFVDDNDKKGEENIESRKKDNSSKRCKDEVDRVSWDREKRERCRNKGNRGLNRNRDKHGKMARNLVRIKVRCWNRRWKWTWK